MIYLPLTTDKFQLVTSSAATIDVNVNYVDAVSTTLVPSGAGKQNTAISSATTTDILASPGASTVRTLKQATWRNKHATLACDCTFVIDANGTDTEIDKVSLQPGETRMYIEGIGFFTNKPANTVDKVLTVASDVVSTSVSFADITGLTCPLLSGIKYTYLAGLFHLSSGTTVGINFGYNIGAAPTLAQIANMSGVTNAVVTGIIALGSATARDTAVTAQTTGSAAVTLTHLAGFVQPSADGTFALRVSGETTAGVTVKAGSWLWIRQER